MIEVQKYLEGQTVDGRYPLIELLGSTEHSSVFRTECEDAPGLQAALKLIPAPPSSASARLTLWGLAARFSHSALLRVFDMGRCDFDGRAMLYVVMELAEENLAEILPVRCLSTGETSAMLAPALDALAYLHGKGFVHGRLQPSNILAIGDRVKLSSDSIVRIGEARDARDARCTYRAPEVGSSPASDAWSLGITMIQCLTGRVPERESEARSSITVPPNVPAPFLDLARHCLNPIAQRRWSIAQLRAALGREPAAASAPEPAQIAPEAPPSDDRPPASAFTKPAAVGPARLRFRFSLNRKYRLPLAILAAAGAAFALGIVISGVNSDPNTTAPALVQAPVASSQQSAPANLPLSSALAKPQMNAPDKNRSQFAALKPNAHSTSTTAKSKVSAAQQNARGENSSSAVIVTSAAPAASSESAQSSSPASGDVVPGAVSRRAVPRIPASASNTIWGTVRVSVIVDVDPRGRVVEAKLDSPGPSRYFASLSMTAARDWKFTPPRVDGNIVPSEWVIDFGYSKSDTSATAAEKHP